MKCKKCSHDVLLIPAGKETKSWVYKPGVHQTIGCYMPTVQPHESGLCYYHWKMEQGLFDQHYKTGEDY